MQIAVLNPDKAGLLSTVLETLLYGFSLLLFMATLYILLRGRPWSQVNRPMLAVACLLFILSTIHLGVDIDRLNKGLIVYRDIYPGGPIAWFGNPSQPSFVFKNAVYSFQTALGDGVVIYRCYKVWQSVWAIVFPCILWLGVAVTAAGSVYSCTLPSTDPTSIYAQQLGRWIKAFYSTTLACNLTATALLAIRLWMINNSVRKTRMGRGLTIPVLLIVMDAGMLYSMTLIAALVCFALESNGQYVVLDMVTPTISIAFYMVIVRVGVAQHDSSNGNTANTTLPRVPFSRSEHHGSSNQLKPMHVQIEVEEYTQDSGEGRRTPEKGENRRGHAV
ncbi:hypothetical protein R3P38DRAFT_3311788 [Favolaschia claudopus]|uniref:Uncharacterized protein n=1 Tax=Favolaschia claudopus TaxID=2862362 RepID=A0AAW0CBP1_9AGAR